MRLTHHPRTKDTNMIFTQNMHISDYLFFFMCVILHVQELQQEIRTYQHQLQVLEEQLRFYTNSPTMHAFYTLKGADLLVQKKKDAAPRKP